MEPRNLYLENATQRSCWVDRLREPLLYSPTWLDLSVRGGVGQSEEGGAGQPSGNSTETSQLAFLSQPQFPDLENGDLPISQGCQMM